MERTRKSNFRKYATGILIAIGFYYVSMNVGSIFNILISYAAGYRKYSDFKNSENIAGFLAIVLFGLTNHIFAGWLTVNTMAKYGRKQNCITKWYFRSAAIAVVVFAVVIIPLLFSSIPGWLVYLAHSLSILLFGRRKVKVYVEEQTSLTLQFNNENNIRSFAPLNPIVQVSIHSPAPEQNECIFCHKCGTKLSANTQFCHRCGTKVAR